MRRYTNAYFICTNWRRVHFIYKWNMNKMGPHVLTTHPTFFLALLLRWWWALVLSFINATLPWESRVTWNCYVMHVLSARAHWLVSRLLQLLLWIQAIEITATAGLNAIYTVHWQCSVCTVYGQWNSSIWCWFDVNYIDKWYLIKRTWYIMCLPYSVLSKLYSLCWVADCFYTQNGSGFCCVLCDWKCGHGSALQEKR